MAVEALEKAPQIDQTEEHQFPKGVVRLPIQSEERKLAMDHLEIEAQRFQTSAEAIITDLHLDPDIRGNVIAGFLRSTVLQGKLTRCEAQKTLKMDDQPFDYHMRFVETYPKDRRPPSIKRLPKLRV